MRRPIVFAVLSFLLLFMQHESLVHALSQSGLQVARSQETELIVPHADGACLECALLAAGTTAALGELPPIVAAASVAQRVFLAFRSRSTPAPSYYSSRAPPALL